MYIMFTVRYPGAGIQSFARYSSGLPSKGDVIRTKEQDYKVESVNWVEGESCNLEPTCEVIKL